MINTYSVLMSVYQNEKPEYLRISMESIFAQSVQTDDFVLICDGPLGIGLNNVIDEMQVKYGDILHVVRLNKNKGLGQALRTGVKICKNEIIARMDSDDISRPYRCEKELEILKRHPDISIVGGLVEEFSESLSMVDAKRIVPETNKEICLFAKKRNPFNHPSVMFRKSDVLDAGNYQNVRYMQDYYLWIHMLIKGYKGYNIQEPLVWMRADSNLFRRRSGRLYMQLQIGLFKYMKDHHFITYPEYLSSCVIRVCSSAAPNWIRKFMFGKILRKH